MWCCSRVGRLEATPLGYERVEAPGGGACFCQSYRPVFGDDIVDIRAARTVDASVVPLSNIISVVRASWCSTPIVKMLRFPKIIGNAYPIVDPVGNTATAPAGVVCINRARLYYVVRAINRFKLGLTTSLYAPIKCVEQRIGMGDATRVIEYEDHARMTPGGVGGVYIKKTHLFNIVGEFNRLVAIQQTTIITV